MTESTSHIDEVNEVRSFPISKLIAYDWKLKEVSDEIKRGELSYSKNEPSLVSYVPELKKYLILDGHHRVLEQKHDGKKSISARVSFHVPKTHNLSSEVINISDSRFEYGGNINSETMENEEKPKSIELVHVYEEDGTMYGTGELIEVKGDKTVVRFDAETIREFDSDKVKPVMKNGGRFGDTIDMDVPLFIRMLEYAKEDAKTDMELHEATENAIELLKSKKELTMEDYNSIIGLRKKLFRGGELENYNKWKSIDWDSFKIDSKQRSNIYRLLSWNSSDRIDWSKMPEEDREWFQDDFVYELTDGNTLEYIFRDKIESIEKEYEELSEHEDISDLDDIKKINAGEKKLLQTEEFKDLRENLDKYGLTLKDIGTKSTDELIDIVSADKSTEWLIDYFLLNDDNWLDFKYIFDSEFGGSDSLDKLYHSVLDNGAVFTEEAEEQQFDLFAEKEPLFPIEIKEDVKEGAPPVLVNKEKEQIEVSKPKSKEVVYIEYLNKDKNHQKDRKYFDSYEDAEKWAKKEFDKFNPDMIRYEELSAPASKNLSEEIDSEIEILNELLEDAKSEKQKELVSELEDRIEFLEDLREDSDIKTLENGGSIKDFSEIIIIFNDNYKSFRLDFYGVSANKPMTRIGWADSELYLESTKVLNLHRVHIVPEYDNSETLKTIISLIKRDLESNTGKTELMINNSRH